MKRLTLTLLLVSLFLTACGLKPAASTTPDPKSTPTKLANPKVTIRPPQRTIAPATDLPLSTDGLSGLRVQVWHGLDGNTDAILSRMAAEFSQKNEWGITVDVFSQGNLTTLMQTVNTALRTPQQPDIVVALPENAQGWDAQGLVADLAPYIRQPKLGLSADEIKDIPTAFWEQGHVDAKQLSVPALRTGRFLFYNVSFAKSLGFNTPPASAEEFRTQACAANASWKTDEDLTNDGFGGLVIEDPMTDLDSPWTAYAWLRSQGGDVFSDGNFAFSTPENQQAVNFLAGLRSEGCAWLSNTTPGYQALAEHKALFVAGSLQNLNDQRAALAGLPDQWTVIPFPGATPTVVVYGPDYVVLKSKQERQLAAWLFMRWMLSTENQVRWSRETSLFPMRTSAIDKLNIRSANPQWAAAFDLLPKAQTYPQAALWSKARLVLGDGFFQLFQLSPSETDVNRTLKMMDDTVKDLSE